MKSTSYSSFGNFKSKPASATSRKYLIVHGDMFDVSMNLSDTSATIARLKAKIEAQCNVIAAHQQLTFEDRVLKNHEHPLEVGINKTCVINMESLFGNSMYCLGSANPVRVRVAKVVMVL